MSLRKLKNPVPQAQVQVSDAESFPVRGLSPANVLGLYRRHTGQLSEMFEKVAETYKAAGTIEAADMQSVAMSLIEQAPLTLAEIIALAAGGDPDDIHLAIDDDDHLIMVDDVPQTNWQVDVTVAGSLAFAVQADAFEKIASLSFTSEMPPKKFFALIAGAIQRAMPSPVSET